MKKSLIILVVFILPLSVGFGLGYGVGHRSNNTSSNDRSGFDDMFSTAGYHPSDNNDSLNDQISNHRQNAITRSVAIVSPAVVGINVTEVREYTYRNPWSQMFGDDPFFRQYFGDKTYKQEIKGLG